MPFRQSLGHRSLGGTSGFSVNSGGGDSQKEPFHARFKGRTHLMNKEGHIGVVKSTEKPIVKGALKYLAQGKLNDSLDASAAAINSGNGGGRNGEGLPKSRQSHMSNPPGGYH